jgi:hypothetical protein
MLLDFNDAAEQRPEQPIPDGTFCSLSMTIRPGGLTLPNMPPGDAGIFKASKTSDVVMLEAELAVLGGQYAKRKFWQLFSVAGGQVDEKGQSKAWNISKQTIRAILESALGIAPQDMSAEAQAKRRLNWFASLNALEFVAKIGIERGGPSPNGGTYPDKNRIAHVVTPDEPEWAVVRGGGTVPPRPTGPTAPRGTSPASVPQQAAPAWKASESAAELAAPKGPNWLNG